MMPRPSTMASMRPYSAEWREEVDELLELYLSALGGWPEMRRSLGIGS